MSLSAPKTLKTGPEAAEYMPKLIGVSLPGAKIDTIQCMHLYLFVSKWRPLNYGLCLALHGYRVCWVGRKTSRILPTMTMTQLLGAVCLPVWLSTGQPICEISRPAMHGVNVIECSAHYTALHEPHFKINHLPSTRCPLFVIVNNNRRKDASRCTTAQWGRCAASQSRFCKHKNGSGSARLVPDSPKWEQWLRLLIFHWLFK